MSHGDLVAKSLTGMAVVVFCTAGTAVAASVDVALQPTDPSFKAQGTVTLTETADGLAVRAQVSQASPGKHGFHIHENGSCADKGNAAGSHFNPDKLPHGDVVRSGLTAAHAGDLGNLEVAEDGTGMLDTQVKGLTLSEGKYSVRGRAVVLHEKEDDFGQPSGNAGGRIACGVIPEK
ncbi:MAG TPA: superoxide dismutase family protein [Verrucomicrobiae bacterium]|jgi:Cu-Zn family superoxide dismutase|nr:superoxide dismutase family protein [Verrucomicrobiae bacterium]